MMPAVALAATLWMTTQPCADPRLAATTALAAWADLPRHTHDRKGRPGDPVNLAFVGTRVDVAAAFDAAGWFRADRESLSAALKTAEAAVHARRYAQLPISREWLFARPQDLAYSQPVDRSIRHRHHVRIWQTTIVTPDGRPVWLAASSYDAGLHPLKLMHRIAREVDIERDIIIGELEAAGVVAATCSRPWGDATEESRNALGDPYCTDGLIGVVMLKTP